jgi:hypothetical protein
MIMPYDPSTDELRRLRNELYQLRLDHIKEVGERTRDTMNLTHRIGLSVIFGIAAVFWIGYALVAVYQRLGLTCGCA